MMKLVTIIVTLCFLAAAYADIPSREYGYRFERTGRSCVRLASFDECRTAANSLGLSSREIQTRSSGSSVPGCYLYSNRAGNGVPFSYVRWNPNSQATGACYTSNFRSETCICVAPAPTPAPPTTLAPSTTLRPTFVPPPGRRYEQVSGYGQPCKHITDIYECEAAAMILSTKQLVAGIDNGRRSHAWPPYCYWRGSQGLKYNQKSYGRLNFGKCSARYTCVCIVDETRTEAPTTQPPLVTGPTKMPPKYRFERTGRTCIRVTTFDECRSAANSLGLSSREIQTRSSGSSVPGCYLYSSRAGNGVPFSYVRWNPNSQATGACYRSNFRSETCICIAPPPTPAPPSTIPPSTTLRPTFVPPPGRRYELVRSGETCIRITDWYECEAAVEILTHQHLIAKEDRISYLYSPPYCYLQPKPRENAKLELKFNSNGKNTGECSGQKLCVCIAPEV